MQQGRKTSNGLGEEIKTYEESIGQLRLSMHYNKQTISVKCKGWNIWTGNSYDRNCGQTAVSSKYFLSSQRGNSKNFSEIYKMQHAWTKC